jgi:mono/diheme cytochrome c family protein
MKTVWLVFVAALCATAGLNATARQASMGPAALEGKRVASDVCGYCHVVSRDQATAPLLRQQTPSFQQIADKPDATAQTLRRFITTTHWDERALPMTMPQPALLDEQYGQVIAYILSLRSPGLPPPASPASRGPHVEAGELIALKQCSICHVVSADPRYRPSLEQPAPSFEAIAADPRTNATSLRTFVRKTHWDEKTIPMTMPGQYLGAVETEDVISYLLSLRKPG